MARLLSLLLVTLLVGAAVTAADAQELNPHRSGRQHRTTIAAANAPVTYRGLTINRPPETAPDDDQDIYRDGPLRYNDIRDFSPAPYTTSGVQFPFGLDGIGGYGSDLDFGAGQDSALYDRGAGSRP